MQIETWFDKKFEHHDMYRVCSNYYVDDMLNFYNNDTNNTIEYEVFFNIMKDIVKKKNTRIYGDCHTLKIFQCGITGKWFIHNLLCTQKEIKGGGLMRFMERVGNH